MPARLHIRYGIFLLVLAVVASSSSTRAADPAATIAPMIDNQACAVVRVDVAKIDVPGLLGWLSRQFGVPSEQTNEQAEWLGRWQKRFLASGAREIFLVVSLADIPQRAPAMLAPIPPGAEAEAIIKAIRTPIEHETDLRDGPFGESGIVAQRGRFIIAAEDKATYERLLTVVADPRPQLAPAFAAAGDTAIQAVLIPSADQRRVIEETLPTLPPPAPPAPATLLTKGLRWAAAGVNLPPKASLSLTIQSTGPASANALRDLIAKCLDAAGALPEVGKLLGDFDQLAATLTPSVAGDRLTLRLQAKQIDDLIMKVFSRAIKAARAKARQAAAAENMKALGKYIFMYVSDHNGEPPTALQDLVDARFADPRLLISPITASRSYVYIRPPRFDAKGVEFGLLIVVYDDPAVHRQDRTYVLFADSHVERMPVNDHFWNMVRKAKDLSAKTHGAQP